MNLFTVFLFYFWETISLGKELEDLQTKRGFMFFFPPVKESFYVDILYICG